MKNKLTQILLAALVLISACKDSKEEAPVITDNSNSYSIVKENRALVLESSATWCPPCHSFGIPANEAIIDTLGDGITNMVMFGTNGCAFQTTIGQELLFPFYQTNSISVPAFFFNKENLNQNGDMDDLISKVVQKFNDFQSNEVEIGIGGELVREGDKLTLNWSIQNFTDYTAFSEVSAYLIEEKVVRGNYTYSNVLRDNLLPTMYGVAVEDVQPNEVRELESVNYTVTNDWDINKLKVVVIVWGAKGRIVNTLAIK